MTTIVTRVQRAQIVQILLFAGEGVMELARDTLMMWHKERTCDTLWVFQAEEILAVNYLRGITSFTYNTKVLLLDIPATIIFAAAVADNDALTTEADLPP